MRGQVGVGFCCGGVLLEGSGAVLGCVQGFVQLAWMYLVPGRVGELSATRRAEVLAAVEDSRNLPERSATRRIALPAAARCRSHLNEWADKLAPWATRGVSHTLSSIQGCVRSITCRTSLSRSKPNTLGGRVGSSDTPPTTAHAHIQPYADRHSRGT
jgi:hypothetical protein